MMLPFRATLRRFVEGVRALIKEFKNNEVRATGVINRGMFEQVKMLYMQDPAAGGELAVSLMEQVLTGDHSSDNFMVAFAIANHQETISKAQHNYDLSKETKQNAIEEDLRKYVDLFKEGYTQAEIAKKLGGTQSSVSKKLTKARKEFPHLFQDEEYSKNIPEYSKDEKNIPEYSEYESNIPNIPSQEYIPNIPEYSKNNQANQEFIPNIPVFQKFQHVNVNDNVNVNVNENVAENSQPVEEEKGKSQGKYKFNF